LATTRVALLGRINSLCASDPFRFVQAVSPFDFDKQPTGQIDGVFRLTVTANAVIGGMNFTEDRTDTFELWVARLLNNEPQGALEQLVTDVTSLHAAIVRDGVVTSGEYNVVDGDAAEVTHEPGRAYAVARLTLPINYEATL
jgi:hypothetical protein